MKISRLIGNTTVLVNTKKGNELIFSEEFIRKNKITKNVLEQTVICDLISSSKKFTPLVLNWELLDKCNFACPFCYIVGHSNNNVVRFKNIEHILQQLICDGLLYCTLTGGEVFLHPDFIEIYKYLKNRGVIVEIFTNASLLSQKLIELFVDLKPYKIEVTIYGIENNHFQKAIGSKKYSAQQILDNIMLLKSNNINVSCKTPLNNLTEKDFESIRKWCDSNKIFHYYSTNVENAYDNMDLQMFSTNDFNSLVYDALKISDFKISKGTNKIKKCFSCSVKKYGFHINSAFEYMPCSEFHHKETKTNLLKNDLSTAIIKSQRFISSFKNKAIVGCAGCFAFEICKMCPAKANINEENNKISNFTVPKDYCQKTIEKAKQIAEYNSN